MVIVHFLKKCIDDTACQSFTVTREAVSMTTWVHSNWLTVHIFIVFVSLRSLTQVSKTVHRARLFVEDSSAQPSGEGRSPIMSIAFCSAFELFTSIAIPAASSQYIASELKIDCAWSRRAYDMASSAMYAAANLHMHLRVRRQIFCDGSTVGISCTCTAIHTKSCCCGLHYVRSEVIELV